MTRILGIIIILIVNNAAASNGLAAPSATELLAARLAPMEHLSAQFSQTIVDDSGELVQQAAGQMAVERPRKFYWRTEQPYEHLVVTDGIVLWVYDLDFEQITREPFSAELDKAPALLLSGDVDGIAKQFRVSLEIDGDVEAYTLSPLVKEGVFKRLTISFANALLSGMTLLDNFDQLTTIQFSEVDVNPEIDSKQFNFEPPEGIDVIVNER